MPTRTLANGLDDMYHWYGPGAGLHLQDIFLALGIFAIIILAAWAICHFYR